MSGESWWTGGVLLRLSEDRPPYHIQLAQGPMALQGGWRGEEGSSP